MLTSQNVLNVETPNLNAILAEYGISINFGAVFEQDTSKMLQNAPEFVIADVSSSFMSNINMAMKMCFVDAGSIQFQDSDKLNELGVTYETIASTGQHLLLEQILIYNHIQEQNKIVKKAHLLLVQMLQRKYLMIFHQNW